jgi:acyl-CoA thioesterase-1
MTARATLTITAALALFAGPAIAEGDAAVAVTGCAAPAALVALVPAQARSPTRIEHGERLTIVAVGSSSTQGVGASAPELTYPSRLEAELKERFPAIAIRVVNRGKSGQDAAEELARLNDDVIAEHPDLVIWQVGTNAVLRRDDLSADRDLIERGVDQLKASGSDVVLMDMQYAPRVVARPGWAEMEQLLANTAKASGIGLFRRFEIMRHWHERPAGDGVAMIGPDGLHMTDLGYRCLAQKLAEALAANWAARLSIAAAPRPPAVAGLHKAALPGPVAPGR